MSSYVHAFSELVRAMQAAAGGKGRTLARLYQALPPYPAIIRGRFDPFQWAAEPQRRSDVFDGVSPKHPLAESTTTSSAELLAPLSHAAIVARELGIPAVVGCGDATMKLHTGDRVCVDGGQGRVEILKRQQTQPHSQAG